MNYSEIKTFDIANGIGVRTSLFVSGCRNKCPGCFNSETWDFNSGKKFTQETINYILKTLEPDYIDGLSILGGEPLEPENQTDILNLVRQVKSEYPDKDIWLWTGFTWHDIFFNINCRACAIPSHAIMYAIDVLVDGPFEEDKKNLLLRFAGSENQRIIDVKKSLEDGHIVEWLDDPVFAKHSW